MTSRMDRGATRPARHFVFMGVCGVGKSTVAAAVAKALGGTFVEADTLHSQENVAAMSAGQSLSDAQRWPWLAAVCREAAAQTPPVMIACSALKARYRDFMSEQLPGAVFLHLAGPAGVIGRRLASRESHFMPPAMLDGQLSTLEPLDDGPGRYTLNIQETRNEVVARAVSIRRAHLERPLQRGFAAAQVNRN